MGDQQIFLRRVIAATFVILLMICGFLLFGYAIQFFLLIFGAILFAVMLRAGTNLLKEKANVPDGLGVAITTLVFIGVLAGIIVLIIPRVSEQVQEMRQSIPQAIEGLKEDLMEYEWGRVLVDNISGSEAGKEGSNGEGREESRGNNAGNSGNSNENKGESTDNGGGGNGKGDESNKSGGGMLPDGGG